MIATTITLACSSHLLLAIPFLMPVFLLGGGLAFMVIRDRM
jgi:hypothetical protein